MFKSTRNTASTNNPQNNTTDDINEAIRQNVKKTLNSVKKDVGMCDLLPNILHLLIFLKMLKKIL